MVIRIDIAALYETQELKQLLKGFVSLGKMFDSDGLNK